jgi:hypothetical protein
VQGRIQATILIKVTPSACLIEVEWVERYAAAIERQHRGLIGRDIDSLDDLHHYLAKQCIYHPVDSSRRNVVAGQQNRVFNAMISGDWSEDDSYVEWN